MEQTPQPPKEPSLEDIGTRYKHLTDHYEAIEAVLTALLARPNPGAKEKEVALKLQHAADITKTTIDTFAGLHNQSVEFQLYRLVNSVPKDPETVEGGRGTPLCK